MWPDETQCCTEDFLSVTYFSAGNPYFEHKKNQINLHKISSFLVIANSIGFFISVLLFLLIVGSNRPSVHCGPFQLLDLPLDAIQHSTNEIFVQILRQIFRLLTSNIFLCFLLFTLLGYVLTMRTQFMGQCHEMRRLERLLVLKANKSEWISLSVGYYYLAYSAGDFTA